MSIKRVTVFEFAPTADEIWCIQQHEKDGYVSYDPDSGLLSMLDTGHDAKQRPEIITTYAGGKATNVARVLDRLLPEDKTASFELITFLPPPYGPMQALELTNVGNALLRPSTPAGIYTQCLQIMALRKVIPRFEIVGELREVGSMQTTRRCIEITFGESGGSLNFSPRMIWSQQAADAVVRRISEVAGATDLAVLAGSPPIWEPAQDAAVTPLTFYARIIEALGPDCQVSIDTRGRYLYESLREDKKPRFAFMNADEFTELSEAWKKLCDHPFSGTLLVHDECGCRVWDGRLPCAGEPFSESVHFPSIPVPQIYSTIGAGDAMHAGFLKEWIYCSEKERNAHLQCSVVYSQVVAAASISNEEATHGIEPEAVEHKFRQIWSEGLRS